MKTSERDLTQVTALFTLPVEDEADLEAVSAEFRRRVELGREAMRRKQFWDDLERTKEDARKRQIAFDSYDKSRNDGPTLLQRLKGWWGK